MKKLKGIFRNYLKNVGELSDNELPLGSAGYKFKGVEQNEMVLTSEYQSLAKELNKHVESSGKRILILIFVSCVLFAIGLYSSFYFHRQPQIMGGILGATFITLLSIIKWLHQLWQEKSAIAISMNILGNTPPKEAVEFMLTLYQKLFATSPVKTVLILSANPKDTDWVHLDKEVREIEDSLLRSMNRNQFKIISRLAVCFRDFRKTLLDHKPQIVHFSGHGEKNGLMVEGELGIAVPIPPKPLADLFKLCSHHVECVILNACHSESQAIVISRHINYVIGMPGKINDRAAIEFAVGFYDALGAGEDVEVAFEFGCNAVLQMFPDLPEHLTPALKKKEE